MPEEIRNAGEGGGRPDDTFKRHGPEPPENDSGPSPSVEDARSEDARPRGGGEAGHLEPREYSNHERTRPTGDRR
jgi:hypothetical protein